MRKLSNYGNNHTILPAPPMPKLLPLVTYICVAYNLYNSSHSVELLQHARAKADDRHQLFAEICYATLPRHSNMLHCCMCKVAAELYNKSCSAATCNRRATCCATKFCNKPTVCHRPNAQHTSRSDVQFHENLLPREDLQCVVDFVQFLFEFLAFCAHPQRVVANRH